MCLEHGLVRVPVFVVPVVYVVLCPMLRALEPMSAVKGAKPYVSGPVLVH